MALFIALLIPLVVLAVVSLQFAFSGNVDGRQYLGWILLIAFGALTYEFIGTWMAMHPGPTSRFLAGLVGAILLGTQAPLLIELIIIMLAAVSDRSGGLKLLKVHTEAEKKVVQDDLPGAILEYESIIAEDPGDIEARFRLAELRYQNKEYHKSAAAYEALLGYVQELDMDRHCSILTRLSEIYAHQLGDIETARAFVQRIVTEYPNTRYAGYARERIDSL